MSQVFSQSSISRDALHKVESLKVWAEAIRAVENDLPGGGPPCILINCPEAPGLEEG
jgi:hypothetical protein